MRLVIALMMQDYIPIQFLHGLQIFSNEKNLTKGKFAYIIFHTYVMMNYKPHSNLIKTAHNIIFQDNVIMADITCSGL